MQSCDRKAVKRFSRNPLKGMAYFPVSLTLTRFIASAQLNEKICPVFEATSPRIYLISKD